MRLKNRISALSLTAVVGLSMAACGSEDTAVENAEEAGNADLIAGDTVTIDGEVQERRSAGSFTVGSDSTLVFGADAPDVEEDDEVSVTGTVVEFVLLDVESDLGVDLDDALYADYENELAVQAVSVEITEGN